MSARARHPHDSYDLPTLTALLAKSAERPDNRGSRLTAEQKLKAQQRGGISPAEWEGEIELAKAKRERKSTGARHNRRGVADLPVATAADLAAAAPRYCRFVDCRKELPIEAHFNARYCRPGDCQDRDEKRREAEVYGKRRGERRKESNRQMKLEIIEPQAKRPKGVPRICADCKIKLKRDEGTETCSYEEPYLLLCEACYRKRGNSVR